MCVDREGNAITEERAAAPTRLVAHPAVARGLRRSGDGAVAASAATAAFLPAAAGDGDLVAPPSAAAAAGERLARLRGDTGAGDASAASGAPPPSPSAAAAAVFFCRMIANAGSDCRELLPRKRATAREPALDRKRSEARAGEGVMRGQQCD